MVNQRIKSITQISKVRVMTGVNARVESLPPQDDSITYNMTFGTVSMAEDGANKKIQCYGSGFSDVNVRVPFIVVESNTGTMAVRGIDYDIVDSEGAIIADDYFLVRSNQLRGDLYIKSYNDATPGDDTEFLIRIVRENDAAAMGPGSAIGVKNETRVIIEDVTTPPVPKVSFAERTTTVVEPDGTNTVNVTLALEMDRVHGADVTATITVLDGSAVQGVDYVLSTGVAVFYAALQTATYTFSVVGNDEYQGDRNVRFQISDVDLGEPLAGSAEHDVTIQDNEVEATWTVQWDPLHQGQIALQEGGTAKAKLVFAEGVANSEDVLVYWTFSERNSSGLVLGSQVTTSATSPVTINAGATFVEIPLTGVTDAIVGNDRDFVLTITGATGGGAEITTNTTLDGTLYDTTVELPTVSWLNDDLSVTEGAIHSTQLYLSSPQLNPITVNIARTGTAGTADLVYQGNRDPIVFPIGETVIDVWFGALQDTVEDPGETATFTIQDGTGYEAGTLDALTVTINEPVSGDTTVEFRSTPLMETLVSVCTGTDPTPANSPPDMMIGGVKADAFPIDQGRRVSNPTAWEFVAFGEFPDGTAVLKQNDGSAVYGRGFTQVDLSSLYVSIQTVREDGGFFDPHVCSMADAQLVEITKSGHYVQDETWLLRPRLASEAGTIHEYCGQVLLFITRRPDCVRVRGELKNEGYDPTRAQGHYGSADLRTELDGTIRFKEFICTTPSTTLRVEVDPDSIACTVGAYPIRQASTHTVDDGFGGFTAKSPPHVLPPQRVFAWDFMVYETSEIPYADVSTRHAILRGSGEGWAVDGPLAYWQHPWFSPNQAFLPEPTTEYQHTTGQTGLAAVRAWGAEYLYDVLHVLNGTVDMNPAGGAAKSGMWYTVGSFGGDQYGWFCPSTYRDNYDPGGGGIMLQNGFDPDYFTQRALWLESRHKVQADCSGIMDITTGLPLTSIVAAANNVVGPGEVNYSPLYGSPNNQWLNREWHWFLPPAAANTAAEDQRRPTDRLWSQLPPLSPTTDPLFVYAEPLEVQSKCGPVMDPTDVSSGQSSDLQNWGAADIDHDVRIHSCYIALAWLRNSSWAKYQLRRKASRVEYLFSYVPVRGQASAGEDFSFPNQDMTMTKYRMDQSSDGGHVPSTNSDNYGGFLTANSAANGGTFSLYRTRGAAHACNVQAAAGAVTPSTAPDYADRQNWWARYLATSIVGATEFGCFERESSRDRQGTLRGDPEQSNHPWGGSPWDPTSVIPKHYSCGQWWKTAWYACRHFSANKVYGDATTYANNIRQFCDTQAFSMFRVAPAGARVAGRTRPMHFIISSGGTWGQEEKPGAIPVSWDVKNADGSPSLADTRVCQLMVESLRGLDEMGETTLYNELLGYVKVFFGLTEAHSLSALAGVLFAEMNRDMRPNQRWAAGYVSDLLGFIQYKQRLGETGGQLQTQLEGRGLPSRPVPVSTIKAQYDAGTWTWSYNYSMPPLTSPKDFLGEHFIGAKSTLLYHSDTSGDLRDMTVSNFVASGSRGDGLKSNGGVGPRTINVSKFHIYGLGFGPDAHADGYQTRGNLISGTFTDGFFDQPCNEGDGTKSNACLFLNNEQGTGDIGTIDVTRCILRGGNYVIFVSDNGVVNLRNTAIIVEEDSPRYGLFNTVDTSRPGSPPGSVTADDDTAIYYYNGTTCTELARGAAVLSFDFLAWHNGMFGRDPAN